MAKYVDIEGLDIKTVNPKNKVLCFLEGCIMISSYIILLFYSKELFSFIKIYLGHDIATILVGFIGMVGGLYILLYRGFIRMIYAPIGGIPEGLNVVKYFGKGFTSSSNRTGYEGIDRILNYTDNIADLSTRDKASERFITSRSIINSLSKSDERTLEYIDAKLSLMSRENGYNFLKSKIQ